MLKKNILYVWAVLLSLTLLSAYHTEWGFFGHRRINRMAVFTLPASMMGFYKKHLEYLTEHAVDPDKRRYATPHEAVRHYIDLDQWGKYPFEEVPRDWVDALIQYTDVYLIDHTGDTLLLGGQSLWEPRWDTLSLRQGVEVGFLPPSRREYRRFFNQYILPQYYENAWVLPCDTLSMLFCIPLGDCQQAFAVDRFSAQGILPYHLVAMQRRLTNAFKGRDLTAILRLSAEFGHYIGDASVPLHTTSNYNGQFTDQIGIHAFWESRLPEIFADTQYDFLVGPAIYINNPEHFYWELVLQSHVLLDSMLAIEKALRQSFPSDQQFCYEERLGVLVRTQCAGFADAYHQRLDGQVEQRMRDAIHAIGSAWFTAWVDAGQPDLNQLGQAVQGEKEEQERETIEGGLKRGKQLGRPHE